MKKRTATHLGTVLVCLACVCLGAVLALVWQGRQSVLPAAPQISAAPLPAATPEPTPNATAAPEPTPEAEAGGDPALVEDNGLPKDQLYVTDARKGYADGALRLIIPKLGVDVPVLDGVDAQTLLRGVGLYDYAQLPGEGGANTSIAGHRNGLRGGKITDNMPFCWRWSPWRFCWRPAAWAGGPAGKDWNWRNSPSAARRCSVMPWRAFTPRGWIIWRNITAYPWTKAAILWITGILPPI